MIKKKHVATLQRGDLVVFPRENSPVYTVEPYPYVDDMEPRHRNKRWWAVRYSYEVRSLDENGATKVTAKVTDPILYTHSEQLPVIFADEIVEPPE